MARITIPRHDETSPAPLSFSQERVWLFDQLGLGRFAYNESQAFSIDGPLDQAALRSALETIVARHSVLRSTFHVAAERPYQVATPPRPLDWREVNLQNVSLAERRQVLQRRVAEENNHPFDLTRDLLLRPTLFTLSPSEHVLLITQHHIAADSWSFSIVRRELSVLYAAALSGQRANLAELPFQYADYARWQRRPLDENSLAKHLEYWQRQLQDLPVEHAVPTDYARPFLPTYRGKRTSTILPARLVEVLRGISPGVNASLFTTMFAALQALLGRLSGQTDVVLATSMMNRNPSETESLIGFFLDLLVLRGDLSGDPSFLDLLGQTRRAVWGAYAHHDVPFQNLVEALRPKRDPSRNPLFQIGFVSLGAPRHALRLPGLVTRPLRFDPGLSKFDVGLYLDELYEPDEDGQPGDARLSAEFSVDLFATESIERLLELYRGLLESIAANPAANISRLPLEPPRAHVNRVQPALEPTGAAVQSKRVDQLFAEQAERTPRALAIKFRRRRCSYGYLDREANRLARHLRTLGIGPGTTVGLCLDPSPEAVIGMLAVFKAGGRYLGLAPNESPERLAFILADAAPAVVVTEARLQATLFEDGPPCVCVDADRAIIAQYSPGQLDADDLPDDIATILYPDGTPSPVGVVGRHRGIVNRITGTEQAQPIAAGEICGVVGVFGTEHAPAELFGPLLRGATVALVDRATSDDPRRLRDALAASGATRVFLTPARLENLLQANPTLNARLPHLLLWRCGGGPIDPALVVRFRTALPGRTLIGYYGDAEVSGAATWWSSTDWDLNSRFGPLGQPVGKTRLQLLDVHGDAVPEGVRGTLYVGGDGVAAGYLRRPERTAERFIPDRFAATPDARLFRTDDVGRALANGSIQLLGKADARPGTDETTAPGDGPVLPTALAAGPIVGQAGRARPFHDWTELRLSYIWSTLLGNNQIGAEDDFFDLGGHSLLAVRLCEQIETVFGKRLPLEILLKAPTIKGLAKVLRQDGPIVTSCVVPMQPTGSKPPLFFVHALGGATIAYRRLAFRLGNDQPFYGIHAPEPKGRGVAPDPVEERAATYVAGIRGVQPEGPYFVGGYSGGGVWAYEMAQQLRAAGQEVAIVVLLDCAFPGANAPRRVALERIRRDLDALEGLTAAERAAYEQWALRQALQRARNPYEGRVEGAAPDGSMMPIYREIQRLHLRAIKNYRPRPYPGRVVHLRAGDPARFGQPGDSYYGWEDLVEAGLEIIPIPGEHLTLLREPNVSVVADRMREQLEQARLGRSRSGDLVAATS